MQIATLEVIDLRNHHGTQKPHLELKMLQPLVY